jgi:D-erythronate 2-dehydrogenase
MAEKVLVTGGFGLVGSQTVRRLAADGHWVVATDLGTDTQRKAARSLPAGVEARWADLTDPGEVDRLIAETSPSVIIHLAAVIPPVIYRQPELARRVNVDATVALLNAARSCARPPRFIQASSNAVHGSRNPHRHHGRLREDTPLQPTDLYGAHKAEVEDHVRSSGLPWVILRLAGIMSVEPGAMPFSLDALFFESALPTDGRMHSIDVRDAAAAFATATVATGAPASDVVGEIFLIAVAVIPAAQLARHARGDARRGRLAALPDAPGGTPRADGAQTPRRLPQRARVLRQPVERYPHRDGRAPLRGQRPRAGLVAKA